jgi:glycosyltransferase involved in cell wall biosynthesis
MNGVAILTSMFPPSVGGIQTQTLALARGLAELGTEVHVVTRPAHGRPAREEVDGVTVHRTGIERGGPAATIAYVALAARVVAGLAGRVSVLHAHQLLSPASVALVESGLRGTPFVVTAHASGAVGDVASLARQGALGRARLLALRELAGAFVAVSGPIRDELAGAGIPEERIHRIPNGVDTRRFAPATATERRRLRRALGLPSSSAIALYTGRLAREKGVDLLLDAWARSASRGPRATLVVVGDGPERAALEGHARQLGIAGDVRFAGAAEDVASWLRAADAFALPSREEGLSVSLLEAMACGLPIVATDVGGTAEAAGAGALVTPAGDVAALGRALRAVLGNRRRARTMGAAARRRALDRYGILEIARRHLELYREVVDAGGSPS